MKLLEYKQYNNSDEPKILNKKKVSVTILAIFIIIVLIIVSAIYVTNSDFRNFIDKYVLVKMVSQNDLPYLNIENDENIHTYAFYNYVTILKNNELDLYNSSGNKVQTLKVNVSSPICDTKNNYLVIAEKGGQKIYLIKDKRILWEKNVDGQISRVNINDNGYVSIIVSGTSYKSVIITYSEDGTEVFRTFLSNTLAVDVDVSKDNKYLSFCEMNVSGTLIECIIKTISIEKAKQEPSNSIINTYEIHSNLIVTNLEYHEKEQLLCMTDKYIYLLKDGNMEVLKDLEKENIMFSGIKLNKCYFTLSEELQGINNQNSSLKIYNTSNNDSFLYTINGIAKNVYSKNGIIAVNLGTEIYFINETGWLVKKYVSNQEVKQIVISDGIAGIIYRNKIEFINL